MRFKGQGPAGSLGLQQLASGQIGIIVSAEVWAMAEPSLVEMRAAIWTWVKGKRDAVIAAGAPTPIGLVQADDVSRLNLNGAALGALAAKLTGQAFAMTWTDGANGVHALDADGMLAVGMAVMIYVGAAHDRARALRIAIEGASDLAALLTVPVDADWPEAAA